MSVEWVGEGTDSVNRATINDFRFGVPPISEDKKALIALGHSRARDDTCKDLRESRGAESDMKAVRVAK
jgi:hypothetical protein